MFSWAEYLLPGLKKYLLSLTYSLITILNAVSFFIFNTGFSYYYVGNGDFSVPCRMIAVTDVSK